MKLLIFVPAAVGEARHVAMLRAQIRIMRRLAGEMPSGVDVEGAVFCDGVAEGLHGAMDEAVAGQEVGGRALAYSAASKAGWKWGIRNPTTYAIEYAAQGGHTHLLRIIQDTFVTGVDKLARHVAGVMQSGWDNVLLGHVHEWPTTGHYPLVLEAGLYARNPLCYVHGAVMLAARGVWERHYLTMPQRINHHWDDCVFSESVVQRGGGGRLINVEPVWDHKHHCDEAVAEKYG